MERYELEGLSRDGLVSLADKFGVARPRVLTQPELIDEIIAKTTKGERERAKARGWLGRARDLLSRVIEKGLHLPEAARALGGPPTRRWPEPPPPLPTVTLAEIYAAQGHFERAIVVLDDVLAKEPEHGEARDLRDRLREQAERGRAKAARNATTVSPVSSSDPKDMASADAAATLPDRYEVDEVVAIAVDPQTLYLYWEVRPTTLAHAQSRKTDGRMVIRVVSVRARWEGPLMHAQDLPIDALHGDLYVYDVDPGSNVRVSVGWMGDDFTPFAVGIEVATPKALPLESTDDDLPVARWGLDATRPLSPLTLDRPWRAAIERAHHEAIREAPPRFTPGISLVTGAFVPSEGTERTEVILRERIRRAVRGGASELAWEEIDITQRRTVSERGGPNERGRSGERGSSERGGSSEHSRGGSSELGRG